MYFLVYYIAERNLSSIATDKMSKGTMKISDVSKKKHKLYFKDTHFLTTFDKKAI